MKFETTEIPTTNFTSQDKNLTDETNLESPKTSSILSSEEISTLELPLVNPSYNLSQLLHVQSTICKYLEGNLSCIASESVNERFEMRCNEGVAAIHYDIYHNGSHGIRDMHLKIIVKELEPDESYVTQEFSVKYHWIGDEIGDENARRSGRPGYQMGQPLLLGQLVKNTTQEG